MLLEFRASNVGCFRDEVALSLLATRLAETAVVREIPWREGGNLLRVLPVAAVFGPNASGKTNILRAMNDMRHLVLESFRSAHPRREIDVRRFRLDSESASRPVEFAVDLVLEGVRHEYGFRIGAGNVEEEWAYRYPHGREALLFHREGDEVTVGASAGKTRGVLELLRPNALLVSTAASANHAALTPIFDWFDRNLRLAESNSRRDRQHLTAMILQNESFRGGALNLLQAADLGITDARYVKIDDDSMARYDQAAQAALEVLKETADVADLRHEVSFEGLEDLRLTHRGTDGDVEFVSLEESLGTLVWLGLVGPILTSLAQGAVLLADELDASLHPSLVEQVVALFQDPATNPFRAQLIFNSHDVSLMESESPWRLGRDQVWFTEKLNHGASTLFPLSDSAPRRGEAVARRYMSGRYGAKPVLSHVEFEAGVQSTLDAVHDGAD